MADKYRYGFTPDSIPPWMEVHTLEREVNGVRLTYLKRGGHVKVYDGQRQLSITADTERKILEAWPRDGDDPISWWD